MKINFFRIFFVIAIFLIVPSFALAAPSIMSAIPVTTFSHGAVVNISGSGFGTKNPVAPAQWDPVDGMYQNITEDSVIPVGGSNPWSGQEGSEHNAAFTLANPRGKFLAKYSNKAYLSDGVGQAVLGENNYPDTGTLYISYWAYPHQDPGNPGYSNKFFRLTGANGWGDANDGISAAVIFTPFVLQFYDFTDGFRYDSWNWGSPFVVSKWNRLETIVDNTANPKPRVTIYSNNTSFLTAISGDGNGLSAGSTTGALRSDITRIGTLGADWSNEQNSPVPQFDWGEVYVDTTLARVEICNAQTKAASTHCEIQIPQNIWTDNGQPNGATLQIKVNQGSFPDGSQQYLYVVDANGVPSDSTSVSGTQGFPVTFSSGSSDSVAPSAPSGLSVS